MNVLRKLALGILSPLFIFLLFATAFDIGFVQTATHPATVKKLVAESGVYDSIVPNLLQQTKNIQTSVGTLSTSDPRVQKAANSLASPKDVQQQTEAAIDSIYQWLDGGTAQPNFKIGLADSSSFANSVASAVGQQVSTLPTCSTAQSLAITQGGQFDALNATCLPRGVTVQSVTDQVKSSIAGQPDLLNNVSVSSADVKSSGDSQSVFTGKLKTAPKQYQRAKKTPLILSILTILTGIGIVFLSKTWQTGLRHIGINLVVVGLIMLAFSWAFNRTVSTKVVPKIELDNVVLQQDIRNLVTDISQQIDKNYWFFGVLYSVIGAGAATTAEIFRRRGLAAARPAAASALDRPESEDKAQSSRRS